MNKKQRQLALYQQILALYDGKWTDRGELAEAIKSEIFLNQYYDEYGYKNDASLDEILTDCLYLIEGEKASSKWQVNDHWRYLKSRLSEMRTFVAKETEGK